MSSLGSGQHPDSAWLILLAAAVLLYLALTPGIRKSRNPLPTAGV